jgi:hypothetical protein
LYVQVMTLIMQAAVAHLGLLGLLLRRSCHARMTRL